MTEIKLPPSSLNSVAGEAAFCQAPQSSQKSEPDVAFLILGGNDVHYRSSVDAIVDRLKGVVTKLRSLGVRRVFVASIIERGSFWASTGLTKEKFNKTRRFINKKLSKLMGPDFIDVGKKIKFPRQYDDDLVHPGARQGGLFLLKKLIERCFDSYLAC